MFTTDLTDEQLASLAKNNDKKAQDTLFSRYDKVIKSIIRRYIYCGNDDLYQVGAMGLLSAIKNYDRSSRFDSFAYACINNKVRSELRKNNSLKNQPLIDYVPLSGFGDGDSDKTEILVDVSSCPEATYIKKEKIKEVESIIKDSLSNLEYDILALFLQEYSYSEIASKTGKTEKAVDNALQRIRKKLRKI